jgi:hypothetical protein
MQVEQAPAGGDSCSFDRGFDPHQRGALEVWPHKRLVGLEVVGVIECRWRATPPLGFEHVTRAEREKERQRQTERERDAADGRVFEPVAGGAFPPPPALDRDPVPSLAQRKRSGA